MVFTYSLSPVKFPETQNTVVSNATSVVAVISGDVLAIYPKA